MELKTAVKLAMYNIQKESITDVDVFSRPFEIDYLKDDDNFSLIYDIVVSRLTKAIQLLENGKEPYDALKELKLSPIRNLLIPKKSLFDFRKCSYTEPIDEIIYLSLVLMISNKIEKKRIHRNKNIIYSYRLRTNLDKEKEPCYLFDGNYSFTPFRTNISKKAQEIGAKVIISCDISNFYDRLNLHRLENVLLSIPDIDKNVVILLNEILLFWSNRDSYGLPVGSNASRILAEASLLTIDKYLLDNNIVFSRFVDDFRLFAQDAKQAHSWLSMLVERLNQEGLFLNTSKTKITAFSDLRKEENNEDSLKNNAEMEKAELPKIIRGYSGIIPTKFRQLSNHELLHLKEIDISSFFANNINKDLIEPLDLQKYIRILVAQEQWNNLGEASLLLNRFPQFIPYYLDCIIKNIKSLSSNCCDKIKKEIILLGDDDTLLEYLRIYIYNFLSNDTTCKQYLLSKYLNLKRGEGIFLGRSLLENLFFQLERDDVLIIRNGFQRADTAEKREILRIMHYCLNKDEFNVFIKNISLTENDPFIKLIFNEKIKIKNKDLTGVTGSD